MRGNYKAAREQSVDVFKVGKMGKYKDLNFDKGQIVKARQLGQKISKTAGV